MRTMSAFRGCASSVNWRKGGCHKVCMHACAKKVRLNEERPRFPARPCKLSRRPERPPEFWLKADAAADLNLPRPSFTLQGAEPAIGRIPVSEASRSIPLRIQPLHVVEHVRDDAFEFQAYALRHTDRLSYAEIHVPVSQAIEDSRATVSTIQPKN